MQLFPAGKDSVLLRIDNLDDRFDSDDGELDYRDVTLKTLMGNLVNSLGHPDKGVHIKKHYELTEYTPNAGKKVSSMKKDRLTFETEDPEQKHHIAHDPFFGFGSYTAIFQQQRIRLFHVHFSDKAGYEPGSALDPRDPAQRE